MTIRPHGDHTYCARSVFTHLGHWRKMYDCSLHQFTTTQYIPIYPKMFSIDIFVNLQPAGWNLKARLFDLLVWGVRESSGVLGWAYEIAWQWVPISSPLTNRVDLLRFWVIYLVPKALEATTSSSSKNYFFIKASTTTWHILTRAHQPQHWEITPINWRNRLQFVSCSISSLFQMDCYQPCIPIFGCSKS